MDKKLKSQINRLARNATRKIASEYITSKRFVIDREYTQAEITSYVHWLLANGVKPLHITMKVCRDYMNGVFDNVTFTQEFMEFEIVQGYTCNILEKEKVK